MNVDYRINEINLKLNLYLYKLKLKVINFNNFINKLFILITHKVHKVLKIYNLIFFKFSNILFLFKNLQFHQNLFF